MGSSTTNPFLTALQTGGYSTGTGTVPVRQQVLGIRYLSGKKLLCVGTVGTPFLYYYNLIEWFLMSLVSKMSTGTQFCLLILFL